MGLILLTFCVKNITSYAKESLVLSRPENTGRTSRNLPSDLEALENACAPSVSVEDNYIIYMYITHLV